MNQYFELLAEVRHLDEEAIEHLYQRYLAGEKTSDLLAEYKISKTVRSLLKVLPPLLSKDLKCPYCDLPMWSRRHARGTPASQRPTYQCVRCEHRHLPLGHYGRRSSCKCTRCYQAHQQELATQAVRDREALLKHYPLESQPIAYASLGFVQKLTLLALLEVVFGILLAWLGANEAPGREVLIGGTLVIGALVINELLGWRSRSGAPRIQSLDQHPS